jgi:subtilisin family serine protease
MCVGSNDDAKGMSDFSSYLNPNLGLGELNNDREEPDGTAVGSEDAAGNVGVLVADHDHKQGTNWVDASGTSMSAPVVAGIAALLRESCTDPNGWSRLLLRALLRTAGYRANPEGPPYSTPVNPNWAGFDPDIHDYRDGGGWISADAAQKMCEAGGGWLGEGEFDLPNGDGTDFEGRPTYDPGQPSEKDEQAFRDYSGPDEDASRVFHEVVNLPAVGAGKRIRATISWNGCGDFGVVQTTAVDIDLYLFKVDSENNGTYTGEWVTGSHSVDDVNEGYEFTTTEASQYIVVAGWLPGNGCEGAMVEPFAWAVWVA